MNDSAYKISLDINKHGAQVALSAKKSDTGRKIYISLRAGGTPYTISDDCYAVFAATKPDGSILYNACTIEGNEIVYEFTEQTCSAVGKNRCEIKLYGLDDKLITSPRFTLLVDGTVYPDEQVESTDEFSALTKLVGDAVVATDNANHASETATNAAQSANEATGNANTSAETATSAASNANNAAGTANTAADNANKATANANAATQSANTAAGTANTAADAATKAAENANEASKAANDAAFKAAHTAKSLMVVGEENGPIISVDDAIEQYLVGCRIFGKTTQDGTPTPDAPVEMKSVCDKGSVTVTVCCKNLARKVVSTGQTAEYATALHVEFAIKPNTTYTVSFKGTSGNKLYFNENIIATPTYFDVRDGLTSITFTTKGKIPQDQYIESYGGWRLFKNYNDNSENKFEEFMLVEGAVAAQYEPFKSTTATVTTVTADGKRNGLPGIPVTSGGNYTDANGQQWICDEIDFGAGVYIKRIDKKVFNGTENGWMRHNDQGPYRIYWDGVDGGWEEERAVASHFICKVNNAYNGVAGHFAIDRVGLCYFASNIGTLEEFKDWLSANNVTVICSLTTPTETPLSAEELAAYAALHTYKDSTTVSNDAGAWMELEYVMDAKKYIDSLMAGTIIPASVE